MCERSVDSLFAEVCRCVGAAGSLLIVTHARPDGDALGSAAALARAARAAGRSVHLLVPDAVPPRYEFLFPDGPPASAARFEALADEADVIVIVDTCAFEQLDGLADSLRAHREKIVVIDHHATADDVAPMQWRDTSAAAAGVMIGELLAALAWPVDLATAEALTAAVATDTGWMRFANTDARCLRVLADWFAAGVRPDKLYKRLYQCDRPERIRLLVRVLQSLELHCEGRLAAMTVRKDDLQATGARPDETENLVNEALRMGSVETAILLVETPDAIRVSLRSRDAVDVSAVAAQFGGGGHPRAAGLRTDGEIDAVKQRLVALCARELAACPPAGAACPDAVQPPVPRSETVPKDRKCDE